MKEINLEQVKMLPNGTKVFVRCIGSDWNLNEGQMNTWNTKHNDGLHYENETEDDTVSFPYDFDYNGNNMSVIYLIEDGMNIYTDEFGNHFDINKIEDITAIINDVFVGAKEKINCDCILGNLEEVIKNAYKNRLMEIK